MMTLMDLSHDYRDRFPRMLSGGERQRVALARSMISSPSVLLLDEPMTALDAKLKKTLQAELKRLHRQSGVTFVHVTHDLEEAMILADRICVMRAGRIIQIGLPSDIYYRPQDRFVAEFIGETNLFEITVPEVGDSHITYSSPVIHDVDKRIGRNLVQPGLAPGRALMMVRPELVQPLDGGFRTECRTGVRIDNVFVRGSTIQVWGRDTVAGHPVVVEMPGASGSRFDIGDVVDVGWNKKDIFVFQARNEDDG